MHEPRIDRRSARTRGALQGALASLLPERAYDEITVAEICDRADVGRSTFYGHFAGKDALKRHALEGLRHELLLVRDGAMESGGDVLLSLANALFLHAHDHSAHYRALCSSVARSEVIGIIEAMLSHIVEKELSRDLSPLQRTCVARAIAAACIAALIWWLDGDRPIPPGAIAALCRETIADGMVGTIGPCAI